MRDSSLKKGLKEFFRKSGTKGEALISKACMRQSGHHLTDRPCGRKEKVRTRMLIDAKTVTGAVVPKLGWMGKDSQSPDFGQKVEEGKALDWKSVS